MGCVLQARCGVTVRTDTAGPGGKKQNPGRIPEGRGGSGVYTPTVAQQRERVNTRSWPDDLLDDLEVSFSRERLSTYLTVTQGNREKALQLYTWNTTVSAAFYGPLQGLEVALRNAIHQQLTRLYGAAWYDNPAAGLDLGGLDRIDTEKKNIARAGGTVNPSGLVAGLSFGFWVSLLGPGGHLEPARRRANYEMTLWRPGLRRAFPHRTPLTRIQAYQPLNSLRKLRNRIAHHEPIFARALLEDHQRILEVTGWISPGARTWIERHSRVPLLLAASDVTAEVHF